MDESFTITFLVITASDRPKTELFLELDFSYTEFSKKNRLVLLMIKYNLLTKILLNVTFNNRFLNKVIKYVVDLILSDFN